MEYHKGQICYIRRYNASPKANGRMAVIVSGDEFNAGANVVVCYLSRMASSFPYVRTGPSFGSYVVPHPVTVSQDRISAVKGNIDQEGRKSLDDALKRVMGF